MKFFILNLCLIVVQSSEYIEQNDCISPNPSHQKTSTPNFISFHKLTLLRFRCLMVFQCFVNQHFLSSHLNLFCWMFSLCVSLFLQTVLKGSSSPLQWSLNKIDLDWASCNFFAQQTSGDTSFKSWAFCSSQLSQIFSQKAVI